MVTPIRVVTNSYFIVTQLLKINCNYVIVRLYSIIDLKLFLNLTKLK